MTGPTGTRSISQPIGTRSKPVEGLRVWHTDAGKPAESCGRSGSPPAPDTHQNGQAVRANHGVGWCRHPTRMWNGLAPWCPGGAPSWPNDLDARGRDGSKDRRGSCGRNGHREHGRRITEQCSSSSRTRVLNRPQKQKSSTRALPGWLVVSRRRETGAFGPLSSRKTESSTRPR